MSKHPSFERDKNLYRRNNVPFYIFVPDFRKNSGGIRALHSLCHALNELGEEAYIANASLRPSTLRAPGLTQEIMLDHYKGGAMPVAVYPEIIQGNPLNLPTVVRWLLNKPGVLNEGVSIQENDIVFFHDTWCLPTGITGTPLLLPTTEWDLFNNENNPDDLQRAGVCFYAAKYLHAGFSILDEHANAEATSLGHELNVSRSEMAALLRKAKLLVCYEPSAIITEALACGCPVALVRSEYWKLNSGDPHLGIAGAYVLGEAGGYERAKAALKDAPLGKDMRAALDLVGQFIKEVYARKAQAISKSALASQPPESIEAFWRLPTEVRPDFLDEFQRHLNPEPAKSPSNYSLFIERKTLQEIDGQLLAERMMRWKTRPLFNLVLEVHDGEQNLLADTLDSLPLQWYSSWHLTIVADFPAFSPELAEVPEITWLPCAPGDHMATLRKALPSLPGDWLCLLEPGCTLEPHALAYVGDTLNHSPKSRLIYCDEDQLSSDGEFENPRFRPDFNLEMLRSTYYIGTGLFIRRKAFEQLGGLVHPGISGLYDLALKASEQFPENSIVHLSEVLIHTPHIGLRPIDTAVELSVVESHLQRLNIPARVQVGLLAGTQSICYLPQTSPLVSIVIPTRNQSGYLSACIESLLKETRYPSFELILVNHQTTDPDALAYLESLTDRPELEGRIQITSNDGAFNYAALCNQGAALARGDMILFLDNDTEFVEPDWLDHLVGYLLQNNVVGVAPRLSSPEGSFPTLNQPPLILGMGNLAAPIAEEGSKLLSPGYFGNLQIAQEVSALSGSCVLIRADIFRKFKGFNEKKTPIHHPVLELCLRLRKKHHKLVWTPWVQVLHRHKVSWKKLLSSDDYLQVELSRHFIGEKNFLLEQYMPQLANDPYYHRHLSLQSPYVIEPNAVIDWDTRFHNRLRILGAPLTSGSGEYRMLAPFRALQKAGMAQSCQVVPVKRLVQRVLNPIELARAAPDTYMLQQAIDDLQITQMRKYRKLNPEVFVVYGTDDIIGNLPEKHYLYNFQIREGKARLREALGLVDRVIASTEPLADFCKGMCEDIVVIPNYLEKERWENVTSVRRAGQKPRVGWAGAQQHLGDLELIREVVEATHHEVEWVFMGMCPPFLKTFVHEEHPFVAFKDYPEKLASLNLDLAIAPLEQVLFNEGKSNLRLLEYGIMGWPVVCTDIYPYQTNHAPVKRVPNLAHAWIEAIRERIHDLDATAREGDKLREWVRTHYFLEDHLEKWLTALTPR